VVFGVKSVVSCCVVSISRDESSRSCQAYILSPQNVDALG
jgi:hypothetical protein